MLRQALAELLAAEPEIHVVAAVVRLRDVHTVDEPFDAVLSSAEETWDRQSFAVLRFTHDDSLTDIIRLVLGRVPARADVPAQSRRPIRSPLTEREAQVLRGVADGLSAGEIASALGIARRSVENHTQRMFAKLGVQSRAHAVAVALELDALRSVVRQCENPRQVRGPLR